MQISLINTARSIKYKTVFSIAYGAGLDINEIVHLKISDIDSERMILRIEEGKGHKDRHAMLSAILLDILRTGGKSSSAGRFVTAQEYEKYTSMPLMS